MRRYLLNVILITGVTLLFIWGANQQGTLVNTNMYEMDQSAYMEYAKNLAISNYRYVGGRNRMPLYPALMALFYEPGMSDTAFFERGKQVGIILGLTTCLTTFLILRSIASTLDAWTGTLVATFTVLVYKAPFFQAEVLFYGIGLVLFYLLVSLFVQPKVTTAIIAGIVAGIGHLTKASVIPAVLLEVTLLVFRTIHNIWKGRNSPKVEQKNHDLILKKWLPLTCALILLFCYLLVIFPYIRTSKERFSRYFYNVNSTFYMWYDSWEEAELGTKAHGDRQGWPDMPADEIPSPAKYIRKHSLGDMINRVTSGFQEMYSRMMQSYGYVFFIGAYTAAFIILAIQNRESLSIVIRVNNQPYAMIFILGYFTGYLFLYAWFSPIAAGNRFVLSLFLPLLLIFAWLISTAQKHQLTFKLLGRQFSASSINILILGFLLIYMVGIFPARISTMFGGR
jgi:hypothetical protein